MTPALKGAALGGLLLLTACAGELNHATTTKTVTGADDTPTTVVPLPGPGGAQSRFSKGSGKLYQGVIDSSGSDWVYIDLDTQTQTVPANPAQSIAWDIAFKGSDIKLNGGSSGAPPSGQPVKVYGDKVATGQTYDLAKIDGAPPSTAVQYVADSQTAAGPLDSANNPVSTGGKPVYALTTTPDADTSPNTVTGEGDYGWYHNAGLTGLNAITPRRNVAYVIRTVECRYYKLQFTAYSDASGKAGHPAFSFAEIPGTGCVTASNIVAPLGRAIFTASANSSGNSQKVAVDATDNNAWVHLDLGNNKQVVPSDPANDPKGWDIALKRTDIKVNGGVSGTGIVAIADGLNDDWDARAAAYSDATKYHTDADNALAFVTYPARVHQSEAQCGNINGDFGWYYYSGFCDDGQGLHHISPRSVVYVVKGSDGRSWKLRLLGYYDSAGTSAHPSLEYAPVTAP